MVNRKLVLGWCALVLALAACNPTVEPTPRPTATPRLFVTEIVTVVPPTQAPSWTPAPTRTPLPTATRLPSSTPRPTSTLKPSATPIGGEPGVISTEGFLTVRLTEAEINAALIPERQEFYFSAEMNKAPTVVLAQNELRLMVNFNDFSRTGIPSEFGVNLRAPARELLVEIRSARTATGVSLTSERIDLAREILRRALMNRVIPDQIKRYAPLLREFEIYGITIAPDAVLITVKITADTPSPTPAAT